MWICLQSLFTCNDKNGLNVGINFVIYRSLLDRKMNEKEH